MIESVKEMLKTLIKIGRKRSGLTQTQLAEKSGVSLRHIQNLENEPSNSAAKLLNVLNSLGWLKTPDEYESDNQAD